TAGEDGGPAYGRRVWRLARGQGVRSGATTALTRSYNAAIPPLLVDPPRRYRRNPAIGQQNSIKSVGRRR
ncbi:MAG: hypothetical protein M1370_06010, partial [Bacteroidetes bacterium]|nr:hypothetical protein [Bacteroidota bacterium]